MGSKRITNLDSLMVFTGAGANVNALALEDRQYDIFSDEYIGKLQLNSEFDSVFEKTPKEIFVETTPRYKSIKDITEIAYAYIVNKSVKKPTDFTEMYIDNDGVINFLYDFEQGLSGKIDNTKVVPLQDAKLYLASLNNGMYNKQKYYSKHKEVESLSNIGVKYFWRQGGSYFDAYDEAKDLDVKIDTSNDYITYSTHKVSVQAKVWDEISNSYELIFDKVNTGTADEPVMTDVPRMIEKTVVDYATSFDGIITSKLNDYTEAFKNRHNASLLTYYLYDLNSTMPVVANTYSFGQNVLNINLNYDGEFNNWFHNVIKFNVKNLETTELAKIVPAEKYWFNLAYNENVRFVGDDKKSAREIIFSLNSITQTDYDGISVLSPYKIQRLDLSPVASKLTNEIDLLCQYNKKISSKDFISTNWKAEKGSKLTELIIGKEGATCYVTNLNGLSYLTELELIDLTGCAYLNNNPDFTSLPNLKTMRLDGSNVSVFHPYPGSTIEFAKLPSSIESIILNGIKFIDETSLEYSISDKLTTLELNNVEGIDTLNFIETWVDKLKAANKLDSGLVNYVNINGVDWDFVSPKLLKDLSVIELNEFTGDIKVWGDGADNEIYRKEYRNLVDIFGQENVLLNGKEGKNDLKIHVSTPEHAFTLNFEIIEQYEDIKDVYNEETGYYETITEIKEKHFGDYEIEILDTVSGNSLIDLIVANPKAFSHVKRLNFINVNNAEIGWTMQLPEPLLLPERSEKLKEINIGDILLFNKQTLIFATKNTVNINQNFTKLGTFTNVSSLIELLQYDFQLDYFYTLTNMEEEIIIPEVDEDNRVEVEWGIGVNEDNAIEVEYGEGDDKYDEDNIVEVEYGESGTTEDNIVEVEYGEKPTYDENNSIAVEYGNKQ